MHVSNLRICAADRQTYLSSELGLTQTLLKSNGVIAFYQSYPQCRWNKVLSCPLHALNNIAAVDDSLYVLCYRRVRACAK